MGRIVHHAIVVTVCCEEDLAKAHEAATRIFGAAQVTAPIDSLVPGYWSFLIPPDGSKEGWEESEKGNMRRDLFHAWVLAQENEEDGAFFDMVEIAYGEVTKPVVTVVNGHVQKRARVVYS